MRLRPAGKGRQVVAAGDLLPCPGPQRPFRNAHRTSVGPTPGSAARLHAQLGLVRCIRLFYGCSIHGITWCVLNSFGRCLSTPLVALLVAPEEAGVARPLQAPGKGCDAQGPCCIQRRRISKACFSQRQVYCHKSGCSRGEAIAGPPTRSRGPDISKAKGAAQPLRPLQAP